MSDVFIEHMVKKESDRPETLKRAGLMFACALLVLTVISVFFLMPGMVFVVTPASAAGIWGLVTLIKRLGREYEYILTNGELDIDVIAGRLKRRRLLSVDCRGFEIMAPASDAYAREMESQTIKVRQDFSSSPNAPGRYFAVFSAKDGARTLLIFQPNDAMRESLKGLLRRKYRDE
ncbi:MAG: hypothetical protein LBR85_06230 [Oscillospiraceae bacterium]|jgi:hypothetical protein|nr:hypothetical protein [Oscillospiraceae bacterium]